MKRYDYSCEEFRTRVGFYEFWRRGGGFPDAKKASDYVDRRRRHRIVMEVTYMLLGIALGLKQIHSFNSIHFDLKPHNVVLNWDEKLKIVSDVRIIDLGSTRDKHLFFDTTAPKTTEKYRAYEVEEYLREENGRLRRTSDNLDDELLKLRKYTDLTEKVDIYSFGKLMEEMINIEIEGIGKTNETMSIYSGSKFENEIVQRCLLVDPVKRPSLEEIIGGLRSRLINLRKGIVARKNEESEKFNENERKRLDAIKNEFHAEKRWKRRKKYMY